MTALGAVLLAWPLLQPAAAAGSPAVPPCPPDHPACVGRQVVPTGRWRPYFPGKDDPAIVEVPAFLLDRAPVTVAQFQAFVTAHPRWQRGRAPRLFADERYLAGWRGPSDPGALAPEAPVVEVSWFAARAYCQAQGARLPKVAEWERAAGASERAEDARDDRAHQAKILAWYGKPAKDRPGRVGTRSPNLWGIHDLHGLVWEWVEDFQTAMVTGESRADSGLDRGLFCGAGSIGSADPRDYAAFMRYALRASLKARDTTRMLGFRCAASLPAPQPAARRTR